ncbi:hypothetical protein EYZ11_000882 [Aspergillus tanneri]|uniref:Uncharacterized protein n=1 Tax=Aspergillus tanneri TaxID=1220188 RepID=A0A4S3JW05_9EURO|nr:hypothetical protein EYZ11_000882 [Aspergillus tanneri]
MLQEVSTNQLDFETLGEDYAAEGRWIALQNLRRIWRCCEHILCVVEKAFMKTRRQSGRASPELKERAVTRVASLCEPCLGSSYLSEVYFIPDVGDVPSLRSVTVYFSLDNDEIIGIEWRLQGEKSGRLLGRRTSSLERKGLPRDLAISGFVLSLGSTRNAFSNEQSIYGLGILTEGSPEVRIKLGSWTDNDLVQAFRADWLETEGHRVVGIAGHYDEFNLSSFGIITADLTTSQIKITMPPLFPRGFIHYRWIQKYPPPGYVLRPISYVESSESWPGHHPPILEAPVIVIELSGRDLRAVRVYFQPKEQQCVGMEFEFTDDSTQLVSADGVTEKKNLKMTTIRLRGERIMGFTCWYGRRRVIHGLEVSLSLYIYLWMEGC